LEFNVPFQHKYGYIRDDVNRGNHDTSTEDSVRRLTTEIDRLLPVQVQVRPVADCTGDAIDAVEGQCS